MTSNDVRLQMLRNAYSVGQMLDSIDLQGPAFEPLKIMDLGRRQASRWGLVLVGPVGRLPHHPGSKASSKRSPKDYQDQAYILNPPTPSFLLPALGVLI